MGVISSGDRLNRLPSSVASCRHPQLLRKAPPPAAFLLQIAAELCQSGVGFSPTRALVLSQVFLSFGIPFALVPLVVFTGSRNLMGSLVNRRLTMVTAGFVTVVIIALNIYLLATGSDLTCLPGRRNLLT